MPSGRQLKHYLLSPIPPRSLLSEYALGYGGIYIAASFAWLWVVERQVPTGPTYWAQRSRSRVRW
jgi:drug/metabolite transporter superfamily protein YnfA